MSQRVAYYVGGFTPAAPQQNRSELLDGATGLYTSWDQQGVQTLQRALTAAEAAALAATDTAITSAANQGTIQQQAQAALASNRTYLAIGTPTNAQIAAQVAALTRQNNGLIRLALNQFDATN